MTRQQAQSKNPKDGSLGLVLMLAMAFPMLILYAAGALAPFMLADSAMEPELLGAFTLASFGVAAMLSFRVGHWVKRLGVRTALMMLFGSTAIAFTALVLTGHWLGMLLAISVCGIAQALANPATNQAIASQVVLERRAFMVGMKQSGVQLSALAAGTVMPWLAVSWGWRAALAAVIPVCVVMMLVVACRNWQGNKVALPKPRTAALSQQALMLLMIMQGGVGIVLAAFITQVPVFALDIGMTASEAAFLITVFGLMGAISRLILTPLACRCRLETDLLVVLLIMAGLAIVATFTATSQNVWLLYAGVIGIGSTIVATNALAMAMILRHHCFGEIPLASGRVSMAFFAGLSSGSLLFQGVVSLGGIDAGMALLLLVLTACTMAVIRLRSPILSLLDGELGG
ncbi:MFS transporter [Photobacterium nomapromontoriensis]|uniref:MFS transporter n=1 Tax=Photobacterium nomapromontoriensis TaxID=2910237 RepID=UPI003D0A8E2E